MLTNYKLASLRDKHNAEAQRIEQQKLDAEKETKKVAKKKEKSDE